MRQESGQVYSFVERERNATIKIPDFIHPETGERTEFGRVKRIPATDAEGCIDPRDSVTFLEPRGELAKMMEEHLGYRDNVKRVEHEQGAERSPGASFGKAMSLAGAMPELSPEQVVDLVSSWEESEGRKFTFHQDDHSHEDNLGCGHIDKACQSENEDLYGVPSEKVQAMKKYLLEKTGQKEMTVHAPMLTQKHREKGILKILSDDTTVTSTDGNEQFFRFDALRHEKSLDRLAEFVKNQGLEIDVDRLVASADQQRNATVQLLAAGLPIYELDLRGGSQNVKLVGIVGPRQQEERMAA